MSYIEAIPLNVYREVNNCVGSIADSMGDFIEDSSKWFGHAFKALQIVPQYMPDSVVIGRERESLERFGVVAGVFADVPGMLGDFEELARDIMDLAGRFFSKDAWFNVACSARTVASGMVHSIVDLGLDACIPLAAAMESWFTMSDGVDMILSEKNKEMEVAPYVCKMGLAVGVFSLGYFSIAGTLTAAQMLHLSAFTAGCGLAKDVYEI